MHHLLFPPYPADFGRRTTSLISTHSSIRNISVSSLLGTTCLRRSHKQRAIPPSVLPACLLAPALAFIGLPIFITSSIFNWPCSGRIAHAFTDSTLLPFTTGLLVDVCAREAALDNPTCTGHRIVQPGGGAAYQDVIVANPCSCGLERPALKYAVYGIDTSSNPDGQTLRNRMPDAALTPSPLWLFATGDFGLESALRKSSSVWWFPQPSDSFRAKRIASAVADDTVHI
jgi:hypothetical protein